MQALLPWLIPSLLGAQESQANTNQSLDTEPAMYRFNLEHPFPQDGNARTAISSYPSQVTAYPSIGGIVLGFFSAVEMVHLQLSRFEPATRSSNVAEEDDLALRMLRLGAYWWPDPKRYAYHKDQIDKRIHYDFHFPPITKVGYPSTGNGVWVFQYLADSHCINSSPSYPKEPDDWHARMGYVLSMDEQCDVLKQFGAKFYAKAENCEDISKTIEQAVRKGNHYDKLLKKMEDSEYLERWLNEV
jgi:hypothetical protein